jgi:hypothetical protein
MGALIVTGVFSVGADAKQSHKHKPKPAAKQREPTATKELLAQCETMLSVSEVSSLTGLTLQAGTQGISVVPTGGMCSADYVLSGTVGPSGHTVSGTLTEIGVSFQGVTLTGGPLNADHIASSSYHKTLTTNQTLDAACPTSGIYPTPVTGVGTAAFTDGPYGQCTTATTADNLVALDGPIVGSVSVTNVTLNAGPYTETGSASLTTIADAVLGHDFEALGLH